VLEEAGYHGIAHGELPLTGRPRALIVLTASRASLQPVLVDRVPWPERVLAVHLSDGTEIVNVHSPISPKPDLAKIRTHEAVYHHMADQPAGHARLLCGDLNTPRKEHPDGTVWTFARDRYGRLRPERGERWDQAEMALLRHLEQYGYRDAFRTVHPHDVDEVSWEWARWGGGYRLDHLIVSPGIAVEECHYQHCWRKDGLSDHSALIARLKP
jgi:exonuclease III